MGMTRSRISMIAITLAAVLSWVLVERTFLAIADGLEAAVEVSQVSAEAAGSVDELSKGLGTLIGSVDQLAGNAQTLANDSSNAANSVADAANGSVGTALQSTGKTAEKLAPIVGFVEGLAGNKGAKQDLDELARSLKPLPKELDGIALDLRATAQSLDKTSASLDTVRRDLRTTKASVDKGRGAIERLPAAAKKAEAAAAGPLKRLRTNLWLWRVGILALWIAALTLIQRPNRRQNINSPDLP
jgi:hypothetical protein